MDYVFKVNVVTFGSKVHEYGPYTYRVSCNNQIGITGSINIITTTASATPGASETFELPLALPLTNPITAGYLGSTDVRTLFAACPIINYKAIIQAGVTQTCAPPDKSVACRTITFVIDQKKTYNVLYSIVTTGGKVN
mgnify:CR=1 FL=1